MLIKCPPHVLKLGRDTKKLLNQPSNKNPFINIIWMLTIDAMKYTYTKKEND